MNSIIAQSPPSFWMPPQSSTVSSSVDGLFYFIFWITAFFVVLIAIGTTVFVIRYRHRPGREKADFTPAHSTALELTWTMIPTVLVLMIFYFGFEDYLRMSVLPPNAYEIQVNARMWSWQFTYPNGVSESELHVPVNVPIRLILSSEDVIHSLFVPQFRVKKDVVPQRFNRMWFQATETGTFDIYCAEYCGQQHSQMRSKVIVQSTDEFNNWLDEASNWEKRMSPVQAGESFLKTFACLQCHTTDGSMKTAPSFRDLFGKQEPMTDGSTVTVDENYIMESLYDPAAKVVRGFSVQMSSYRGRLKDQDVRAIIAYLKSISKTGGTTSTTTAPTGR